jgi:hypothetical protein
VGLTTLPCKIEIVKKPPRNSAGFCEGGQGLRWAVEPRKEDMSFETFFDMAYIFNEILVWGWRSGQDVCQVWRTNSIGSKFGTS